MRTRMVAWIGTGAMLAACGGGTPGAQPHDMSTSGHEEAARGEEQQVTEHEAQYDPLAARTIRCGSARVQTEIGGVCWTSDVNPTDEHRAEAERHVRAAADHRAAAQALRDAEAAACTGIDDLDRDMSPFAHREDIASVAPLTETVQMGRQTRERGVGATVVFRATPGMTVEWLQRLVDCHLARNASLGHSVPEMEYCPLVPRGVTARVRSTGDGFAVELRGEDDETAAEILRRAQSLAH